MINRSQTLDAHRHQINQNIQGRKLPPIPNVRNQQLARADFHQVPASIAVRSNNLSTNDDDCLDNAENEGDDDNEVVHDEEGYDVTEDVAEDRLNRQKKPGKLDLRQFDNITTAIARLKVQPISASPTSVATISNANSPRNISISNFSKSSAISKQTATDIQTSNLRRLNNLRHGRAVAPPKLPSNLLFKGPHGQFSSNEKSSQNRTAQSNDEDGTIDFSLSPITHRLLKYSKNYKVSELNSPNESDSESNQLAKSHENKSQNIKRSWKNDKSVSVRDSSIDTSELINSRDETIRQLNEILAKKPPGANNSKPGRVLFNDQLSVDSELPSSSKKTDKDNKKDRKKLRSDEKLEKRKIKEERLRRQEEEKQRRQEKKLAGKKSKSALPNMDSLSDDGIPLFIKCCIEFIESEGLEAEGIYRVPGNRAHVDAFVQKFKENPEMSILESDIPVNAVATALKDFLSKKWGPIIPLELMKELTELSNIWDKNKRVEAVKELVNKLPAANYKLLKYVFSHFVKVSSNNTLNSMDSKNLAICWWPTLLPLHFNDMVMFEQMRPHLEESIQTMIDQYDFVFSSGEPNDVTS